LFLVAGLCNRATGEFNEWHTHFASLTIGITITLGIGKAKNYFGALSKYLSSDIHPVFFWKIERRKSIYF
jgi:hypothetical protein